MFRKSFFSVYRAPEYPPFFHVIQSIHSPLFGDKSVSESPCTSIINIGLWRERYSESVPESQTRGMSICSLYHGTIYDPKELIKRVDLMQEDYLNKSLKESNAYRPVTETLVERKRSTKSVHQLYGKVKKLSYFIPELYGGVEVADRLVGSVDNLSKVYLTIVPETTDLRADDAYLLSVLLSFPSPQSYSLAAALLQAVTHATQRWF